MVGQKLIKQVPVRNFNLTVLDLGDDFYCSFIVQYFCMALFNSCDFKIITILRNNIYMFELSLL